MAIHPDLTWDGILWIRENQKRAELRVTEQPCLRVWRDCSGIQGIALGEDPPDCVIEIRDGARIGVEVCRLMDEEVLRLNLSAEVKEQRKRDVLEVAKSGQGRDMIVALGQHQLYRRWTRETLIEAIRRIITEKDGKSFSLTSRDAAGPATIEYRERWLAIPVVEFELNELGVRQWLERDGVVEFCSSQFDRVFLLFPWVPTRVRASVRGSIPEPEDPSETVGPVVELRVLRA
ncbi:MAG: hypothetical protein U1F36_08350 [Planctomycetota bacterium]